MSKKQKKYVNRAIKVSENAQTVVYPILNSGQVRIKQNGHLTWRNNNPGNLEFGQFAKDHGAIGVNNNFAVFPDIKTGENAQVARLKTKMYQSQSIAGAIEQYAPKEGHNDSVKYIKAVTKWTGMSADKKLSSMTPREFNSFIGAIRRYEGAAPGVEYVAPKNMGSFAVLASDEIAKLKTIRRPVSALNPVKHHSHAGPLADRTLRRAGDTVYRFYKGKVAGSFISPGKKK